MCFQYLFLAACSQPQLGPATLLPPASGKGSTAKQRKGSPRSTEERTAVRDACSQHKTHPGCSLLLAQVWRATKRKSQWGTGCRNCSNGWCVSSCMPCFRFVPSLQEGMCSIWSCQHHQVGAVSLVMHEGRPCGINSAGDVLVTWRNDAEGSWWHPDAR